MTLHDAALTRLSQWYKRALRAGHAYAENAALHAGSRERHRLRHVARALVWGLVLPGLLLLAIIAGLLVQPWALLWGALVIVAYGMLIARVYRHRRAMGEPKRDALLYSLFCVAGKLPEALGVLMYAWRRMRRVERGLIEYK